ncbi:MAG: hypothetical protein NTY51_08905 [Deltaproteobacteria bacterium]|nr:hypothetical protein [Deltaproteobacteria bacterium]
MVTDKKPTKPVSKTTKKSTSKKPPKGTLKLVMSSNQPLDETIMFTGIPLNNLTKEFKYETVSPEIIPPNADDLKVIRCLKRLDQYISKSADYNKYWTLLTETQNSCMKTFDMWLTNKGVQEDKDTYTSLSNVYLTFIYGCDHEEPITIKNVCEEYIVEFMMDFVLTRTTMKPLEYTLVPAAMMLFHIYLYEKGYLDEPPDGIVDFMDELEPEFIEILKKRFSCG